jgi:hypothetical protein
MREFTSLLPDHVLDHASYAVLHHPIPGKRLQMPNTRQVLFDLPPLA